MKLETIVSRDDIAKTYGDEAYRRHKAYFEVLRNKRASVGELAERFNLPNVTVWQWRSSFAPRSVRCIDILSDLKLLPLTKTTRRLKPLNELAAWAFWSGTISRGDFKRVEVSVDERYKSEVTRAIRYLDLRWKSESEREAIHITKHNYAIGRLLYCMGLPTGKKAENGIELPHYLKKIDKPLLKDFVDVLFKARHLQNGNRKERIYLFASRSRTSAEHFAESVEKLVARAGYQRPDIKIVQNKSKDNYLPMFYRGS